MKIDPAAIDRLEGQDVHDPSGSKIGSVSGVYLDDDTGAPEWVTVRTGLLAAKESFIPLRGARLTPDGLQVQVHEDAVRGAPSVDADRHLSPAGEEELYRYYGEVYSPPRTPARPPVSELDGDDGQTTDPLDPPEAQRNVASPPGAKPPLRRYGH